MERERSDIIQAGTQLRPHLPGHGHKYGSVTWNIGIVQRLTEAGAALQKTIWPYGGREARHWPWRRCVPSPRVRRRLCAACRHRRAAAGWREARRANPGWGTRTRTRRDSSHGGCDRRRRLAPCSARSERERGGETKNCIKMCNCGRWHAAKEKVQLSISLQVLLSTYWVATFMTVQEWGCDWGTEAALKKKKSKKNQKNHLH